MANRIVESLAKKKEKDVLKKENLEEGFKEGSGKMKGGG